MSEPEETAITTIHTQEKPVHDEKSLWGILPGEIWLMILDIECSTFDEMVRNYPTTMSNPYFGHNGFFELDGYSGSLLTIQRLNKTLRQAVLKSIMTNVSLAFDSALWVTELLLGAIGIESSLFVVPPIRKLYLSIYLIFGWREVDCIHHLLDSIIDERIAGPEELTLDFISYNSASRGMTYTIDYAIENNDENIWSLFHKIVKTPVKKLTLLGFDDQTMAVWIAGFAVGDWSGYDQALAYEEPLLTDWDERAQDIWDRLSSHLLGMDTDSAWSTDAEMESELGSVEHDDWDEMSDDDENDDVDVDNEKDEEEGREGDEMSVT